MDFVKACVCARKKVRGVCVRVSASVESLVRALLPHLPDIINCLVVLSSSPVHHVPSENGNHPSPSQSVRRSTWKVRARRVSQVISIGSGRTTGQGRSRVVYLTQLPCRFPTFQELTRKYFNYCTCFMSS